MDNAFLELREAFETNSLWRIMLRDCNWTEAYSNSLVRLQSRLLFIKILAQKMFLRSIVLFTSSGVCIVIFFSNFLLLKKNSEKKKREVNSTCFCFLSLDFKITFFVTLLNKALIGINPIKTNFRLNFTQYTKMV